ncbi:L-ascorbate metabolism protein UlaG, beta-lactamase superfamily [Pseudovibrio denitrificans]|uniref:L-ascorbate metabolism protein UlaG, beta-lactamase superfamily n=1 Tax=Pseudovibrio denitrificans TaxID=258256 RepID=A0A1I7D195_9HYPH|nr:MBL fold metallo-hydrolase [Pseudovibrio denitrificans]SFU05490.1 L-ascorbate metabolism protein UlaG, beta-lactamase superfamily [Pseudovibrio denitrificans]
MIKKIAGGVLGVVVVGVGAIYASAYTNMGQKPDEEHKAQLAQSDQWADGSFANKLPMVRGPLSEIFRQFILEPTDHNRPQQPVPTETIGDRLNTPPESGARVTWFGHSTLLVELEETRILIDPVWSKRASPLPWAGVERFYDPLIALEDLPEIDAVVISHDHYDHLDMATVQKLAQKRVKWIVPLGVGSHLEYWGVASADITELDWWQSTKVEETTVTATPSRHRSGRSVTFSDVNATLWAGWAFNGLEHAVFYSGDTGMHDRFEEIGERLGPFDLTVIETGAYNPLWKDTHLGPEQAVLAHKLVKGKTMLPVHWGLFDLSSHNWTEPVERVMVAAEKYGVDLAVPLPGGSVEPGQVVSNTAWWPQVPWKTAEERPIWATRVEEIVKRAKEMNSGEPQVASRPSN